MTAFYRFPAPSNVSAEIFVVCRDFLAPAHIDPKFLDPRHVFKDLSSLMTLSDKGTSANNAHANVFAPEKKRRKREGYEDGALTLFKEIGVSEFVNSQDPVMTLGTVNRMTFSTPEEKTSVRVCSRRRETSTSRAHFPFGFPLRLAAG